MCGVCPVDCCVPDPDNEETEDQLLEKRLKCIFKFIARERMDQDQIIVISVILGIAVSLYTALI